MHGLANFKFNVVISLSISFFSSVLYTLLPLFYPSSPAYRLSYLVSTCIFFFLLFYPNFPAVCQNLTSLYSVTVYLFKLRDRNNVLK